MSKKKNKKNWIKRFYFLVDNKCQNIFSQNQEVLFGWISIFNLKSCFSFFIILMLITIFFLFFSFYCYFIFELLWKWTQRRIKMRKVKGMRTFGKRDCTKWHYEKIIDLVRFAPFLSSGFVYLCFYSLRLVLFFTFLER